MYTSQHIIQRSITKNEEDYYNVLLASYAERLQQQPDSSFLRQKTRHVAKIVHSKTIHTWEREDQISYAEQG